MYFKKILGHKNLVRRLQKASHDPGHAYIFEGEDGMGKGVMVAAFAKILQCEENIEDKSRQDACGACLSCRVFESGNHPDIIYVKAEKTRIGVDDVRNQIVLPMTIKPFRYRYKIFIIAHAETMTPAAQNALLKTIEEPAPYGIFLFMATHVRNFLPTVLSRCVTLKLHPLPDDLVADSLRRAILPEDTIRFCTAFAMGNPGRAKELAQSEDFAEMHALAQNIADNMQSHLEAFELYPQLEKRKESIQDMLDMLYMCYRDKLEKSKSIESDLISLDTIAETKQFLYKNGNFQLAIELMLMKLAGDYVWK